MTISDPLRRAVTLHAELEARPRREMGVEELGRLGETWDRVAGDREVRRLVEERAYLIGATSGHRALQSLRDSAVEDLAELAERAEVRLDELAKAGESARRAAALLRERLLSEVEMASDALRRRVDEGRALPPIDEWREFLNLKLAYERAGKLGGKGLRQILFQKVHPDACALGVWLWNERRQKSIGNALFRWLRDQAEDLGDYDAAALQEKNVACGA